MNNLMYELLRQWRAMCRYRTAGLLVAFAVAVLGAAMVFSIPKKYEANARVFVNTDSILKPLMVGMMVQADAGQRVALLSRLVINRPNVEELIAETYPSMAHANAEEKERLIDTIMRSLEISGNGGRDNIYVIKYKDTKQGRARRMVELLVEKFISTSTGGIASDSKSAKKFLDEQVNAYEVKLKEAETNLKNFKIRNIAAGEDMNYVVQLAAVAEQLSAAKLQLHEAESSRDTFRRGMHLDVPGDSGRTPRSTASSVRLDVELKIDKARQDLETLLQKYTDQHPDVVGARRTLAELQEQRLHTPAGQPALATTGTELQPASVSAGPRASEQLSVSLLQAEATVASLQARVSSYTARYRELQAVSKRMPEFEAELAQLNRDYEVNKKNYESLVTRRESASIAGDMQAVAGVGDFRLIDPPRVSPIAVSTARSKMLALTIVAASFIALTVMFLAKEIRSRIYDLGQLRRLSTIPVLGVVSKVQTRQAISVARIATARFYGLAIVLACTYSGVLYAGLTQTRAVA